MQCFKSCLLSNFWHLCRTVESVPYVICCQNFTHLCHTFESASKAVCCQTLHNRVTHWNQFQKLSAVSCTPGHNAALLGAGICRRRWAPDVRKDAQGQPTNGRESTAIRPTVGVGTSLPSRAGCGAQVRLTFCHFSRRVTNRNIFSVDWAVIECRVDNLLFVSTIDQREKR